MKGSILKTTGIAGGVLIALLLLVIIIRALLVTLPLQNTNTGSSVQSLTLSDTDRQRLIGRLSQAIQYRTISRKISENPQQAIVSTVDASVFGAFHEFLRVTFPATHQRLNLQKVDSHSLLFTWPGRQADLPPVVVMAHQDVVPAALDTIARWRFPPFAGTVTDGFVWGRGTLDNKSSLMAILEAVEALVKTGWQPSRTIYLAFGHDEEVGGHGARVMASTLGELPVQPAMVLDEGGFVLNGVIPGVSRPVALVGIAEKGFLTLRLSAQGSPGHSSMPPRQTAAGIIAAAVTRLESQPPGKRLDGATALMFSEVSPYMPFLQRAIFSNLWLFGPVVLNALEQKLTTNATIRTTQAVTMLAAGHQDNVLPASASATINYRLLPGDTEATIVNHAHRVIDDNRVKITPLPSASPATPLSAIDSPGYRAIESSANTVFAGEKVVVSPYLTIAATDARHFAEVSENQYRFLPIVLEAADLKRIHGVNERISIDDYLRMIHFYKAFITDMTASQAASSEG